MCGCEPGFTCPRCEGTHRDDGYPELPDERFTEMIGAGEWEERAVPNLADFEARP